MLCSRCEKGEGFREVYMDFECKETPSVKTVGFIVESSRPTSIFHAGNEWNQNISNSAISEDSRNPWVRSIVDDRRPQLLGAYLKPSSDNLEL